MATFRILSIDGGGIRGIVPAVLLKEIETRMGRPIASLFNLIAGTSTGGLLALGLSTPAEGDPTRSRYAAADMVKFYVEKRDDIFVRRGGFAPFYPYCPAYDVAPFERVLKSLLDSRRLSDAITSLYIPTFSLRTKTPFVFKSRNAKQSDKCDFEMWKVARATAAAPTYFAPLGLEVSVDDKIPLIDGGVYANNPAMGALVESFAMLAGMETTGPASGNPQMATYEVKRPIKAQKKSTELPKIVLVSIGTGEALRPIPLVQAQDFGLAEWLMPILDIVFEGVSNSVDYQVRQLATFNGTPAKYFRFQPQLQYAHSRIDDTSLNNIQYLQALATNFIKDRDQELNEVCKMLKGKKFPLE